MSDIAIRVRDLVKEYEVYAKPVDLALEVLTRRKRHTIFRALDGVCFDVRRGEVLGIIGSNGAGKSTLLKVITGVLEPSSGRVDIEGRVTAILELGLGFNPEYSGRENIYLSGLLYGMDRKEINGKIEEIIAFSGLADFIERPVKTYSSGMHSRLAFSIATAVEPDILIIDEALAAGDSTFVQKCMRRIRQLCSGGRTVLLVSHGTGLLAQLCERVIWIEQGRIKMVGQAINVVQAYDLAVHQNADASSWIEKVDDRLDVDEEGEGVATGGGQTHPASGAVGPRTLKELIESSGDGAQQVFRRGPVFIEGVEMFDAAGELSVRLTLLKPFSIRIRYRTEGPLPEETLGVALAINGRYDLSAVAQFFTQNIRPFETRETYTDSPDRIRPSRSGSITLNFESAPFRKGEYFLSLGLVPNAPGTWEFYEYRHFYYTFSVDDAGMDVGAPIFLDARLMHSQGSGEKRLVEACGAAAATPEQSAPLRREAVPQADAEAVPGSQPLSEDIKTLRDEIEAVCREEGGYPATWPRHERCPACAGGLVAPLFEKYGFNHSRCNACGFVCVDPFPPDEILNRLYSGAYYSRTRELFELPLLEQGGSMTPFSAPADILRGVIEKATGDAPTGSWLDVGGGLGAFANLVRQVRPGWTVALNELNPQSVAIAKRLFDFSVISDDPARLRAENRQFDVVSSVAVLEHIPEPYDFLLSYADLVKPGGWLITVVPHFSELNAQISQGSSANVVPPYHVSLFGENALRRLLFRLPGLRLVALEQAGPAAFELIHHPATGDYWDITIPTAAEPTPRSILLKPYEYEKAVKLNALQETAPLLADFFAQHDGKLYLIAYCQRQ